MRRREKARGEKRWRKKSRTDVMDATPNRRFAIYWSREWNPYLSSLEAEGRQTGISKHTYIKRERNRQTDGDREAD